MARRDVQLRLTDGDADGALALLEDAERVFVSEYYPVSRPVPAQAARIQAARGRLRRAPARLDAQVSVDDDLTYVRGYEHITLVRLLLAEGARVHDPRPIQEASAFLERLLVAAVLGGRWRSVVEILVLQALAHRDRGHGVAGLEPLGCALTLAEPEGYVQTFVAEGGPMADMLDWRPVAASPRTTFDACGARSGSTNAKQRVSRVCLSHSATENLSPSASRLRPRWPRNRGQDGRGAEHRPTHTKSIYAKFGVNSRRAAVRRGEELGLISRSGRR